MARKSADESAAANEQNALIPVDATNFEVGMFVAPNTAIVYGAPMFTLSDAGKASVLRGLDFACRRESIAGEQLERMVAALRATLAT